MINRERLFALTREDEVLTSYNYHCLVAPDEWKVINAVPLRRMLIQEPNEARNSFMSMRLSTGIVGELDCPSGDADYVPRNKNEVIIGLGDLGIEALIKLGGLPCISCHSGEKLATLFPEELEKSLKADLSHATDNDFLVKNYDARRLDWPKIVQLGIVPGRFYTRPGLGDLEISAIVSIFKSAGLSAPAIGYYDRNREDRFFRYN